MKTIQANMILNIRRYSLFEISQKGLVLCSGSVIDALCCLEKRWLGSRRLSRGRSQRTAVSKCKSMHILSHSCILLGFYILIVCLKKEFVSATREISFVCIHSFIHRHTHACRIDLLSCTICTSPVPCIRHLII